MAALHYLLLSNTGGEVSQHTMEVWLQDEATLAREAPSRGECQSVVLSHDITRMTDLHYRYPSSLEMRVLPCASIIPPFAVCYLLY